MKLRFHPAAVLAAVLLAAAPCAADNGDQSPPAIIGTGECVIEKPAELLRVNVEVDADGPSTAEAIKKLKARKEQIKAALVKMGAVEASIELGDAHSVLNSAGSATPNLSPLVQPRGAARPAPATRLAVVSCSVKADWQLKAGTGDDAVVAANEIQEKIAAAHVFEDAAKSPAKAEIDEEGGPNQGDSESGPKPGEPTYFYVARITEAERTKASATAFARAKADAARLAKAAGAELGALRSLTDQPAQSFEGYSGGSLFGSESPPAERLVGVLAAKTQTPADDGTTEAYSSQPGKISQHITLAAGFAIK